MMQGSVRKVSYLLNLCILIIDGLQEKTLRNLVKADVERKTIQCLEMLLNQWKSNHTDTVIKAMRKLQRERSKYVGHGGAEIDFDIKEAAVNLTKELSHALEILANEIVRSNDPSSQ